MPGETATYVIRLEGTPASANINVTNLPADIEPFIVSAPPYSLPIELDFELNTINHTDEGIYQFNVTLATSELTTSIPLTISVEYPGKLYLPIMLR